MPKSYRFRTEVGVDKEIRLNINQHFDFLEILSLKLRQEDLYDRFCADYGVVAGRVVANGGFGVPNVSISVFVPLDSVDENNPIISTLYPYKDLRTKNEDGYRYNLLPYVQEYGGHTPTGTFPDRNDLLTRKEVLQVYEKYYKYTVKTNESGDFMIVGVPLGQQKLVMDLDLSNIGAFSLRPSDLIRMGMGVESQFNGQLFKSSEDLDSLPQIINSVQEIDVTPFWGENDLCDVGIVRSDFDLRELGIEITPHAIFMGSIFSSNEDDYLKASCKPKKNTGNFCDLTTGPGNIKSLRQTIGVDENGDPVLEEYKFENNGYVIDDEGTWLTEVPMNLDYVITNEFGEQIISNDPSIGIPTKGKYRFKVSWMDEAGLDADIMRAKYLIPNIKEHGWTSSTSIPNEETRNKSYAFSLSWDDYYDKESAINCEDTFYLFNYNKVYTVASHIDRFKWGFNRNRYLGIKEINDRRCQSENNKFPVNDAKRNGNLINFLFNFLLTLMTPVFLALIPLLHVLAVVFNIIVLLINVINFIIKLVTFGLVDELVPLPSNNPFKQLSLPMISFPDCDACSCTEIDADTTNPTTQSMELLNSQLGQGALIETTMHENFTFPTCSGLEGTDSERMNLLGSMVCSGYDGREDKAYENIYGGKNDENEWLKSPVYPVFASNGTIDEWMLNSETTLGQNMNLMNRRAMYFGINQSTAIKTTLKNDQFGPNPPTSESFWDNVLIMFNDPGSEFEAGQLITFNDPNSIEDPNIGITGTSLYNENDYVEVTVKGLRNNPYEEQTYEKTVYVYNPTNEKTYDLKSGVEYFQVITAMTLSDVIDLKNPANTNQLFDRYIFNHKQYYGCDKDTAKGECSGGNQDLPCFNTTPIYRYNDYQNIVVTILVRGVDVYTPKQKIEYDLSRVFGYTNGTWYDFNGEIKVNGEYYMNIPIQPNTPWGGFDYENYGIWRNDYKTPSPHFQRKWGTGNDLTFNTSYNSNVSVNINDGYTQMDTPNLFNGSYTFILNNNDWQNFNTKATNKYISLDKSFTFGNYLNAFNTEYGSNGNGINCPDNDYPTKGINSTLQQSIEGCGYQYSKTGNNRKVNQADDVITMSPLYLSIDDITSQPYTVMSSSQNLIFRSDRLPSSDVYDRVEDIDGYENSIIFRRYAFNLNAAFTIFKISENGETVLVSENLSFGPADESFNAADASEGANQLTTNVLNTFGCSGMVPLDCYSGEGDDFGVETPCDIPGSLISAEERVVNGCYQFVVKNLIFTIFRDWQMFIEYRARLRFTFALCQGVIGEMFHNNWVNGTLYLPSFQKQTIFNGDNEVSRYRYCGDKQQPNEELRHQGPLYFNNQTNTFYYRSTPFNDSSNNFIGQTPSRDNYKGQNEKNLWFPTTIMDLGPRDNFIKEISLTPEFEGFIMDKITTSSYKDVSDIVNLFVISRLTNSTLLGQLFGAGDGSIGKLFSREETLVDGDLAQMLSINSEFGVLPYLEGNYEDSISVTGGDDGVFGIWFSSNTINRRIINNGVTTFGLNPNGPTNYFGYPNTQLVPHYMWKINNNYLFGTDENDWSTNTISSSYYQNDKFFEGSTTYMMPQNGYGLGYIYNRDANGNEISTLPNNGESPTFKVGSPFHFYFGLKRGKSAINRYINKYFVN